MNTYAEPVTAGHVVTMDDDGYASRREVAAQTRNTYYSGSQYGQHVPARLNSAPGRYVAFEE